MDSKKWLGACRKAVMLAVLWVCVYPIFFVWIGSFAGDSERTCGNARKFRGVAGEMAE